jgi:hypothetical protein
MGEGEEAMDTGFGGGFGVVFFEKAVFVHGGIFGAFFLLGRCWRFEDHLVFGA